MVFAICRLESSISIQGKEKMLFGIREILKSSVFLIRGLQSLINLQKHGNIACALQNLSRGSAFHHLALNVSLIFRKCTKLTGHLRKYDGKCLLLYVGLQFLFC